MDRARNLPAVLVLLATIACGPPRVEDTAGGESETSSDTTTTDSSTSETSTDDSTTSDLVPRPDLPADVPCDPWLQDCPEGQKCAPYSQNGGTWDAHKCVPILGDQAPGELCEWGGLMNATDDCDGSGVCFDVVDVGGEYIGTCHAFCTGTPESPECPEGSSCALTGDGVLTLCIPDCDPVAQDCEGSEGCYWTGTDFFCVPSSENLGVGEPCEFANACAVGLICAAAEVLPDCAGVGCCTPFCNVEWGDAQCEALTATSCVPFFEVGMAPPGYELVGICISP